MTPRKIPSGGEKIPELVREFYDQVVAQTADFCKEYLTEEFSTPCQKLVAKLARKRPSPLLGGRLEIWSCAVIYTIARVNFLFDPKSKPCISGQWLCKVFGTSQSTVSAKVKDIIRWFRIYQMDPEYTPASKLMENPLAWMLEVNGIVMDIRTAPRELQEAAYERGLIPFIPADRREP
jgi:hypothetical protein